MNYLFADLSALELFFVISITFKVPQVSVLFNFQGPACSPLGQLNHYIKGRTFCQALFRYFFELSERLFKSFRPHAVRFPAAFLLVHRFYLAFEELLSCATAYL